MPIKPTNRPGEWLTVFPLNEHQELMTLEDFQLLCPPGKPEEIDGDKGKHQSPAHESAATTIGHDTMHQLVHVHYHAAGFNFWVQSVDPYSGDLAGYARVLGSRSEGHWCVIHYWDMAHWRIPYRILLGEMITIPIQRDIDFTTRTLREALVELVPAEYLNPPVPDGGLR